MEAITEFLDIYLPIIDGKIPTNINAGGCGIFAKYLHRTLQEMGFNSKMIIIAEGNERGALEYLETTKTFQGKCCMRHCLVTLNDETFFDSKGATVCLEGWYKWDGSSYKRDMSEEILDLMIAKEDLWNPVFDRRWAEVIKAELDTLPHLFELYKVGDLLINEPY